MSTIGRTFSVLNLVLAALFLGWAANTLGSAQDYKGQLEDATAAHDAAIADLNERLAAAQTDGNAQRTAKDQFKNERDDAQASIDRLTAEVAAKDEENASLRAAVTGIDSTLQTNMQGKDDAVAAAAAATEKAHEAQNAADEAMRAADAAKLAQAQAEADLASAMKRIDDQMDDIVRLQGEVTKGETLLAVALDKSGLAASDLHAQPYISATVMKAIYDVAPGMVALQVGKSDGVKKGYTFEISRGAQYKGRVKVTQVHDNQCSALITDLVPGQTIAQGDKAETNL